MKKGYMKTLEAFLAIFGTFLFILFVMPERSTQVSTDVDIDILSILTENDEFRSCVISINYTCIDSHIKENFNTGYYNYTYNVTTDFDSYADIDRDDVFVKTAFISGNGSLYSPRIFRFYYWVE